MSLLRHLLLAGTAVLASGCANLSTVFREFDLERGRSVTIDAQQRAILVNQVHDETGMRRIVYCAEPSPDSLFAIGASFGGSGNAALASGAKGGAEVAQAMASAASDALNARNATIQLLRDGLYRACEAFAAGALSRLEYAEVTWRYQKMVLAALSIELVSNLNRPRRESSVTGTNAAANPAYDAAEQTGSPDKPATPGATLDGKSTPAEAKGIAVALQAGTQAGASSTRSSTPALPPYSDSAIQRISETAVSLVTAVLRSEDRIAQCFRYLSIVGAQRNNVMKESSAIHATCVRLITENLALGGDADVQSLVD